MSRCAGCASSAGCPPSQFNVSWPASQAWTGQNVRHGVPASMRYEVCATLKDSAPGRPASGTRISRLSR